MYKLNTNLAGGIVSTPPTKAKLHIRIQEVENGFIITYLERKYRETQYVIKDEKELGDMVNMLVQQDK